MHGLGGPKSGGTALRAAGVALVVAVALLISAAAAAASGPVTAGAGGPVTAGAGGPAATGGATIGAASTPATATNFGVVVPAPGSLIVVRRISGQDSLWSVDPANAMASQLVTLPFRPASVSQSPGGRRLAYLPMSAGPAVYVYDTKTNALVKRSLAAHGVKVVDSLTWLTSTKLLVAGKATAGRAFYPFADRLWVLNAATGAASRFRNLAGTEPSVAPAGTILAYVRLSDGGRITSGSPMRWVIERLYRLKLAAGTTPHLLRTARYPNDLDIRRFHDPSLSQRGSYLTTSTTGSDISVSYMVRATATGAVRRTINTALLGRAVTAWSNHGNHVALWSMPLADNTNTTRLLIYSPATDLLSHSATLSKVAVTGLAWSSNDASLAYSLRGFTSLDDVAELWTIDPTTLSLTSAKDLGAGSLPVFAP